MFFSFYLFIVVYYYLCCMVQPQQHSLWSSLDRNPPSTTHFPSVLRPYAVIQSCVWVYVSANFHNEILISLEGKMEVLFSKAILLQCFAQNVHSINTCWTNKLCVKIIYWCKHFDWKTAILLSETCTTFKLPASFHFRSVCLKWKKKLNQ